jgi:carboxyl-terminal processing protease
MCLRNLFLCVFFTFFFGFTKAQSAGFEVLKNLELIDQIYEYLDLYFVDEIAHGKLSKTAIDAMLNELDPYTVYYHEANIEDYKLMTTGQYGGVGATIGTMEGATCLTELYEGSPAQKSGLLVGDKVVRIDNKNFSEKKADDVSTALKGPKGTTVLLEVERAGKPMSFTITRDEIQIPDIPYADLIDARTGYISLSSFTQTASEEVKKNILALQAKGMEKLVFDLRGNGGGLLMEAVKIVGFFVPKGQVVVSTKGRSKQENMVYTTQENPIAETMPLVILIDENSASASEIVAGALQDLDRAVVLGTTSYGKGLVQRTLDLKYGSKIKLTIAKYYTPSGRCVQRLEYYDNNNGNIPKEIPDSLLKQFKTKNGRSVIDGRGIEPDVEIEDSIAGEFAQTLFAKNMFFNYATQYHASHGKIDSVASFSLTNQDYAEFQSFVRSKNFQFQTKELALMEKLKNELEKSNQYNEVAKDYEALKNQLLKPISSYFEEEKTPIKSELEREIIGRYYFQKGQIAYSFKNSTVLKKAQYILSNTLEYQSILQKK